jgi:uncharacterized membrane protein
MSEATPPLNYPPPPKRGSGSLLVSAIAFVLGVPCGIILVTISGFFMYGAAEPGSSPSHPSLYWPGVICYALVGACALGGAVFSAVKKDRWMFLAGLLLGIALMSLVEGSCFYSFTPI